MYAQEALEMARAYTKLGWAVQEQAEEIIGVNAYPGDMDELQEDGKLNLNAVRMILEWIDEYSEFIEDGQSLSENIHNWLSDQYS